MRPLEIVVIVACVLVVGGVVAWQVVRKKKGKGHGWCDCSSCPHCSVCAEKKESEE